MPVDEKTGPRRRPEPGEGSDLRLKKMGRIMAVMNPNIPAINLQLRIKTDPPSNNTFMGSKDLGKQVVFVSALVY